MSLRKSSRRPLLQFQTLEQRDNPAANIVTSVSGGTLLLTGTDEPEIFTITQQTGNLFTITGVNGTLVNGVNMPATTTVAATSIKMLLKGGGDNVAIDSTAPFALTGSLAVDGGDGANIVSVLTTTMNSPVSLGGFSFIGGEGEDTVTVGQAEATSPTTVGGALSVTPGGGGSEITVKNATVNGDLTVKAGIGEDDLTLTDVAAKKNVNIDAGFGDASLTATGATVITGGLGYKSLDGDDTVSLTGTTINGKSGVTISGGAGDVDLTTTGTVKVAAGGLTLAGSNGESVVTVPGTLDVFGDFKANNLTVKALNSGEVKVASLSFTAGDLIDSNSTGTWTVKKNFTWNATSPVGAIGATLGTLNIGGSATFTSLKDQNLAALGGLIKGGFSQTSKTGGTILQHTGAVDLEVQKNLAAKGAESVRVNIQPSNSAAKFTVGGDASLTSSGVFATLTHTAGSAVLSGGLKISGRQQASAQFNSTSAAVAKEISVTSSAGSAAVSALALFAAGGKVTVTGATDAGLGGFVAGDATFQKDVTITAKYGDASISSILAGPGNAVFNGKTTLTGGRDASILLANTGTATTFAGDLKATATRGTATLGVGNGPKTFNGNVTLKGYGVSLNQTATTAVTTYAKNLTLTGGKADDTVTMAGLYKVNGDATFNLGEGNSDIALSSTTADPDFAGKVTVKTGNANDSVAFVNVQAARDVSVTSLAGADKITVDGDATLNLGSVFSGVFTADLGAGDDTFDLGRKPGLTGPAVAATFNGKVTLKAGAGNDTLFLGRSATDTPAGDARSIAVFGTDGSTIDGGTGFNSYDDELGQGPITLNLTLPGFSDPTPL